MVGFYFSQNDLLPLQHQHLLPVASIRIRFYFALATALDVIFKTGKGFHFHFQPDKIGGRGGKGQEKWSYDLNSEVV